MTLNWITAAFNKASLKVLFFRVTKFSCDVCPNFLNKISVPYFLKF